MELRRAPCLCRSAAPMVGTLTIATTGQRTLQAGDSPVSRRAYPDFFSCATAASAAWKPILLWVPSQNGLVTDAPHRQSAKRGPRALVSTLLPFTSTTSTSPSTRYGPFGRMLILTAIATPPRDIYRRHHSTGEDPDAPGRGNRARSANREDGADALEQRVDAERLGEDHRRGRLQELRVGRAIAVPGHEEHHRSRRPQLRDGAEDHLPVDVRHPHVADDEVVLDPGEAVQGRLAAVDGVRLVPIIFEHRLHQFRDLGL